MWDDVFKDRFCSASQESDDSLQLLLLYSTISDQIRPSKTPLKAWFKKPQDGKAGWEPKRGLSTIKRCGMKFTKAMAVGKEILAKTRPTFDSIISSRPRRLFCFKIYFSFYVLYLLSTRNWFCLLPKEKKERRCTVQLCAVFTGELGLNNVFHTLYFWWIIYLQTLIHMYCFRVACLRSLIALDCVLCYGCSLCRISLVSYPVPASNTAITARLFGVTKAQQFISYLCEPLQAQYLQWVFVIQNLVIWRIDAPLAHGS